jgi:hypothetical protein
VRRFLGGKEKAQSVLKIQQAVGLQMNWKVNNIPLVRVCQKRHPERDLLLITAGNRLEEVARISSSSLWT